MQIICSSLQADNHASTSIFYRPDAIPDDKPTVFQGTKGNTQRRNVVLLRYPKPTPKPRFLQKPSVAET